MARTKAPIVPEQPVPVVGEDELRTLLWSLAGKDFKSRRDNAAVRLFLDTGLRLSELSCRVPLWRPEPRPLVRRLARVGPVAGEQALAQGRVRQPDALPVAVAAAGHVEPGCPGGSGFRKDPHVGCWLVRDVSAHSTPCGGPNDQTSLGPRKSEDPSQAPASHGRR